MAPVTTFAPKRRQKLFHPLHAHARDRDLCAHVAADKLGLTAVGKDNSLDIAERPAAVPDLHRRDEQALVIELSRIRRR
jgi:hypothetical protein